MPTLEEASPAELIQELINRTNPFSFDPKTEAAHCVEVFRKNHRTLQQNLIRFISCFIKQAGEVDLEWTDARNEAAIAWCSQVGQINSHFPFI